MISWCKVGMISWYLPDPVNADMEEKEEEVVSDPVNVASINSWMEAADAAGVQFVQYEDEVVVDNDNTAVETVGEIIGDNKEEEDRISKFCDILT